MTEDNELLHVLDLDPPGLQARARTDTLERPRAEPGLAAENHIEYDRDLGPADLEALKLPRGGSGPPRALARIHSSHHALARCIAAGMRPAQAALVTGYSPGRISALANDPAFSALVADYRAEVKSVFADLAERMNLMSLDAIEILQERLHAEPGTFTIPVLVDLIKTFADRTGHGPGQEVSVKMSVDLIDRPPRESYEDWQNRRNRELDAVPLPGPAAPTRKLN